jgi:hypothetical protein
MQSSPFDSIRLISSSCWSAVPVRQACGTEARCAAETRQRCTRWLRTPPTTSRRQSCPIAAPSRTILRLAPTADDGIGLTAVRSGQHHACKCLLMKTGPWMKTRRGELSTKLSAGADHQHPRPHKRQSLITVRIRSRGRTCPMGESSASTDIGVSPASISSPTAASAAPTVVLWLAPSPP